MADAKRPAEVYRRLWRNPEKPNLQAFVAAQTMLTPEQLLDIVEVDQTERWQRQERIAAETYFKAFPSLLHKSELAIVVIYGEYFLRTERGEQPSLAEYMTRFPRFARRLREQVQWHEAIHLVPATPLPNLPSFPGYETIAFAGRGATCCVYEARDILEQTVAIKTLDAIHRSDEAKQERFRREGEAGVRLRHPHIVATYGVEPSDAGPFLVLEFCAAGTLAAAIRGQQVPLAQVPTLLRDIADAVHYAHEEGIIHRDLKPGNILRTTEGVAKVADFGLAKVLGSGSLTATGEVLGTPCYMAPEQTHGTFDVTTDVYALGAILYECLTGRPPFVHANPLEILRLIREEAPVPPHEYNAAVPPDLEALCLRCLAKDPGQRFPSAAAVRSALA